MSILHPSSPPARLLSPLRSVRHRAVVEFLHDRLGRVWFSESTYADLRNRGLSAAAVDRTLEELAGEGAIRIRPGFHSFGVELVGVNRGN